MDEVDHIITMLLLRSLDLVKSKKYNIYLQNVVECEYKVVQYFSKHRFLLLFPDYAQTLL